MKHGTKSKKTTMPKMKMGKGMKKEAQKMMKKMK